ncbi:MAG: DUF6036 family nucleotidyltransferase [Microbacteriaceae bacterium]
MITRGPLELDPSEVKRLLEELQSRLTAKGVAARIYVFGGSAMALQFPDDDETRMTQDIDASFQPTEEVREVIATMAEELGLSPTWMNSNGMAYIPPREDSRSAEAVVTIATVEELIAMKLAASREQDLHDLGILARKANITDPQRLVDIAFEMYGHDSIVLNESEEDYLILATQALQIARRRSGRRGPST